MRRAMLALLFLAACSNPGAVSPGPSGSPARDTPTASTGGLASSPTAPAPKVLAILDLPNTIALVGSDGSIAATAAVDPAPFRAHIFMSRTSASHTRLYYLTGGSEVRSIVPGAPSEAVTRITLGANQQVGISVSPDDTRIAVAVFSYTPAPVSAQYAGPPTYTGMRLYVEDLRGGGHHVDIFSSTSVAEYPIGWTGGRLVLAVGDALCCQAVPLNPYAAAAYHVVDPATAARLAGLCDNSLGPMGPIEPFGAACAKSAAAPEFQRWDGSPQPAPVAVPNPEYLVAVSPDGTRVAIGGGRIRVMGPGANPELLLAEGGYVFGWLDASHIIYQPLNGSSNAVLDVKTDTSTNLPAGLYLGTFPAAIS